MQTNPEALRRFNAIQRLQQNLLKNNLTPYWSEVYEKALEFALNISRSVNDNFYYRVVDDAKRTVRRNKKSGPSFLSLYTIYPESSGNETENPLLVDYITPEQEVIYLNTIEQIRHTISKSHKHAVAIFYSMLEGFSVKETAKKLQITESLVKKIRASIVRNGRQAILN